MSMTAYTIYKKQVEVQPPVFLCITEINADQCLTTDSIRSIMVSMEFC